METQSAFMAAAAATVLLIAIVRTRRDRTGVCFAALALTFGAWSAARGAGGLGWAHAPLASALGLVALGALAPAAAQAFSGRTGSLPALRVWLWLAPPCLAVTLSITGAEHPAAQMAASGWAMLGVLTGSALLMGSAPATGDPESPDATRLRYLAVAHGIVVLGAAADLVAWLLGGPRVGSLLTPLLYLYAGYLHLARVRVADLRQLMGNAVSLTFLAGGLAAAFAGLLLWVGPQLDLFLFNAFVASFVLLLLLEPSRLRIQRAVDRRFVKSRLELERRLGPLRERLAQVFTLDELIGELLEAIEGIDRLRAAAVFLREDPHVGFQQVGSVGLPPRRRVNLIRSPDWAEVLEAGEPLLREEIEKARSESRKPEDSARLEGFLVLMRQLDAQLVLPLRTEAQLLGFWTLSEERSSEPFSSSELELLRALSARMAVAIENSRTFERVRVRDRLASLGEMAGGLAHEIRNPLATIRGALAVIGQPDDDQQREFHDVMLEEIERLDRVVATFLDYARPAAPPAPITDLGEFVRGCAERVARGVASNDVELVLHIEPGVPAATANADQLERVIANLVLNAYQAAEGKGSVEVTVRRRQPNAELPDCAEILIEDDGRGMDASTLERAMLPFFTTKEEGSGLGLALCDRLARAQGGTLQLLSRPNEGTAAVIRLPVHVPIEGEEPAG